MSHFGRAARLFARWEVAALMLSFGCLVAAGILDLENDGHARVARTMMALAGLMGLGVTTLALARARRSESKGRRLVRELGDLGVVAADSVRFAIVGDTGHRPERAARVAAAMASSHRGAPLAGAWLVGDVLDGADSYLDAREEHIDEPFAALLAAGVPLLGVLGNHDHSAGYADELAREPLLHMQGRRCYSRTFGEVIAFFVLDSERLPDEPGQVHWLRGALESSTARWRVLLSHHPLVASETGHGPDHFRHRMLRRVLAKPGLLHLVVSGHNHVYERSRHRHGVTHIVVGTGSVASSRPALPDPALAVGLAQKGTWLHLEATPDWLRLRAMALDGTVVDEFVLGMLPRFSLPQPGGGPESP